ncbi:hypothetical protein GGS24DRAFT_406573 [Hypoxylon argillaceum]|nr:hypothetical protein GGS24DRAFT_406573 [Hypoxylon argillaceum]
MPCRSEVVVSKYCAALDMWATLHQDGFLRVWSLQRREHVVSLQIFREIPQNPDAHGSPFVFKLLFCPARPELILIQVWSSQAFQVEVWDWERERRISLARDAQRMFSAELIDWVAFVPRSTLIYAADTNGYLMIVDLDTPWISREISLARLVGRATESPYSAGGRCTAVLFLSDSEIWTLWQLPLSPSFTSWGTDPTRVAEMARLPLASYDQEVSIKTRYSDAVISKAHVTVSCRIKEEFLGTPRIVFDSRTGSLLIHGQCNSKGQSKILILDLATGAKLSQCHQYGDLHPLCSEDSLYTHGYFQDLGAKMTKIFCVEDGRDLGMLPLWLALAVDNSGKLITWNYTGTNIEFGVSEATLDELAGAARCSNEDALPDRATRRTTRRRSY